MTSLEELIEERKDKLTALKEAGRDPYPSASTRTHRITEVLDAFKPLAQEETTVCIAGRIMAIREHGGSVFVDVDDGSDEIQLYIKKDILADDAFDLFVNAIDRGDFVEFTGTLFETNRGEKSVEVQSWKILAKSLRPLPEKWHGIQDAEKRFRRRYLDMLLNTEVKERIRRRARFFRSIRDFLQEKGFLEVQTPVIETTPGGADARPFETHHNALDLDVYLRISAGELWQKQLMVGGFEKVFELGRIFRNEGMSPEHLQDYMQMEFYWAYADYEDGMRLVKELFRYVAQETYDTQTFSINGFDVDLAGDWERYDYVETVKDMVDIDVLEADT
ncbi:MAG: lysine--tRNA ligase, partial [Parcubacteria group bacterium SW_4_46_8]